MSRNYNANSLLLLTLRTNASSFSILWPRPENPARSCGLFLLNLYGVSEVELTGAEIIVRFLQDEGVEHLFGYPGGAVLHIYDAIYKQDKITHVLVRHEQAAAHAADGYARSTGKPGV